MPGYRSPSTPNPAGPSCALAGKVTGSRPDGSATPITMSASASAPSSPGYQVMRTAPARDAQGISTGEPALTTTTVRGLTSSTASTSSRWRPGSECLGGGGDGALELVARVRGRRPDACAHDGGGRGPRPDLDGQVVGVSGAEID